MIKSNGYFFADSLHKVGFNQKMIDLIMFNISSATLSVIWYGKCPEPFYPQRGIRQGDLLAPYLFLMRMEVISPKIEDVVASGSWSPIKTSRTGPAICHLFFADDLLLFGEASPSQAKEVERIIIEFCRESGQTVSVRKSQVLVSRNIATRFDPNLFAKLGLHTTVDFGNYLGVPLMHGRSRRKAYAYLLDKIRTRLGSLQTKLFSQDAR